MESRTYAEYSRQQRRNVKILIEEGVNGITQKDTMPNSAFPLVGEAEAMYFKGARDFLETTLAHIIYNRDQDVFGGMR